MRIIPITLPTPFRIGPVNVYLVPEDPVTLIDTGPRTKAALETLRDGLRGEGLRVHDIRRIILTHTHEDHCGLARSLRDEAKTATVFVHPWEMDHRAQSSLYEGRRALLLARSGVPAAEITLMQQRYESMRRYSDTFAEDECQELFDGQELEFASGSLRVVHTPGHTPGSCSLLREADRTVIAGDCVLKRITPNPILSPDPVDASRRFRSLEEYLVSLARLRSFAPTLVHTGHGEPVTDYEELFNRYLRRTNERQKAIINRLPKQGATGWTLANQLFPDVDAAHRFFAVSETVAHLGLAHSEGKIIVEINVGGEGYEMYRRATGDSIAEYGVWSSRL